MIKTFNQTDYTGYTDYLMSSVTTPWDIPNYSGAKYQINWRWAGQATGYNIINGTNTLIFYFDTPKSIATDEVKVIKCGYKDIYDYGFDPQYDQNIIVQIKSGSTILQSITFVPLNCNGNNLYCVDFINKWGVWEKFYFAGRLDDNITYDYEIFKYNKVDYNSMTYNNSDGTYHRYNTQGKGRIILNTGWLSENKNNQFEELLLSDFLLIDGLPYIITDKEMRYKTTRWDKAINYTLNMDRAYDKINQVI